MALIVQAKRVHIVVEGFHDGVRACTFDQADALALKVYVRIKCCLELASSVLAVAALSKSVASEANQSVDLKSGAIYYDCAVLESTRYLYDSLFLGVKSLYSLRRRQELFCVLARLS